MRSDAENSAAGPSHGTASLVRALDQSERVQDLVEEAAADLSSVNAALKDEIADGPPQAQIERALDQTEAIEANVLDAAEELVAVNEALSAVIDQREALEEQLSESNAALSESRSEERRARHSA